MMDILAPVDLPVSTLAMLLLLGPVVVIWALMEVAVKRENREVSPTIMMALRGTSIMTAVLFLCYFCENYFPFDHAEKVENPMMYWGTFAVLMIVSLCTMRKTSSNDFLCREQTEEWKGWMQFLFLAYHYWKMEGAYNDIRVYITCYLWMTGFGNFSFFYVKGDFSLLRVMQMLFRINFFVFFLCMTMNNVYIVYYICPLHSAYFLVSYATMGIWSKVNHSQMGAAAKVLVCSGLLYVVYDGVPQIFHLFFAWLGTESTGNGIGSHGVEWEWYFRTFLDHFSTAWGMVFALNMPFLAEWFKQVESFSARQEWAIKLPVLGAMVAAFVVWFVNVYSQVKSDYNALHCYYSIVPLLAFLFLRNISATARSYYLHALHWFGAISLESYILQYHIWLAANAGMLLNIVPGYPILTYIIATCLHVFCAYQIFQVTNNLRTVIMPNDLGLALRNSAGIMGACLLCVCTSVVILQTGLPFLFMLMIVAGVSLRGASMLLADEDEKGETVAWWSAEQAKSYTVQYGIVAAVSSLAVLVGPRLLVNPVSATSFLEMVSWSSRHPNMELMASNMQGNLMAFDVGSLAQPWHGLFALSLIVVCVVFNDPFFGLCRLSLAASAPEGRKTISWEQAYGPLLHSLGVGTQDPERAENAPLVQ